MKRMIGCGVVAVVLLMIGGLFFWGVGHYNSLTRKQVAVDSAWAQVENVYQRRLDLIPNLVETVKGAANFERGTLEAVIEARAKATQTVISPGGAQRPGEVPAVPEGSGRALRAPSPV